VSVADWPAQIVEEFTETTGLLLTFTAATAVLEQPAVEPVTVYELVLPGETVNGLFVLPVLHK
jgi:hypothetical protein